jgi:hypothetical protein
MVAMHIETKYKAADIRCAIHKQTGRICLWSFEVAAGYNKIRKNRPL